MRAGNGSQENWERRESAELRQEEGGSGNNQRAQNKDLKW